MTISSGSNIVDRKKPRTVPVMDITGGGSVLSQKAELLENPVYKPKSQLTGGVYKELLNIIQTILVSEASDVLYDAAHDIIEIMRSDRSEIAKKNMLKDILPSYSDEIYSTLLRLSGMLSDFEAVDSIQAKGEGDNIAVVFDEEDEAEKGDDSGSMDDEMREKEEEEREKLGRKFIEDTSETSDQFIEAQAGGQSIPDKQVDPLFVPWTTIEDPYWLRNEISKVEPNQETLDTMEQAVYTALGSFIGSVGSLENTLVSAFNFKHFDLCKLIVSNRFKIFVSRQLFSICRDGDKSQRHSVLEEILLSLPVSEPKVMELTSEIRAIVPSSVLAPSTKAAAMPHPSTLLDLSTLVFEQGGRLMSNPSFNPAQKTYQISKKDYDEVHVDPPEKISAQIATNLVHVKSNLPEWSHPVFENFENLNPVQSQVFPIAFHNFHENMMICAPTGAGKTNIAMLTILNVLQQYYLGGEEEGGGGGGGTTTRFDYSQFKIVYVAPMKALVQEVVKSFNLRLNPLGILVAELSGDSSLSREQIAETHVIVTTPEKWDVITRKAGESVAYTQLVRLIIIDEVHLLHDSRGPVIESIVSRTIRQSEQTGEHVRLVALSATLPNYQDVAVFLRVNLDKGLFYFGPEYRPVPLEQTYVGINSKRALKRAQITNEVVYEKVMDDIGKNQILVFVHGRKETFRTARALRDIAMERNELAKLIPEDSASKGVLSHESQNVKTAELKDLLPFGIGIHHAGLPQSDRATVEDLFAARHLNVCVATLTLAWGVNLPAHTVIIKGTQIYSPEKGDWVELSPMDMLQMIGRAGRPQYDTSGHGIIITNRAELQYYLSLNNMQLPIESQMLSVLPDCLNAEIALGTVNSREDAAHWIGYTYLYVRMLRNPGLYSVSIEESERDEKLLQRRVDLAHAALTVLEKNGLVKYDRQTGAVHGTVIGRVASHFYLRNESMAVYNSNLKQNMSDIDLLRLFALSREFKYIPVRDEEKVELSKLVEMVPIPIKGGSEDPSSKINVLLQTYVSRLSLEGFALMSDMVFVTQNAGRLFRALFEISLKRGWSNLARKCLTWCKCVELRMWPVQSCLRHFRNIGEDICRKIERKGLSNEELVLLNSEDLGEVLRAPRLGSQVHSVLGQIPKLELVAYIQPVSRSLLSMRIEITPDYVFDEKIHTNMEYFWLMVEDVGQQHALYYDQIGIKHFQVKKKTTLVYNIYVPVTEPVPPYYFVRVVSDRWMGAETVRPVSFRHLILPSKSVPPTEIEDLEPIALTNRMRIETFSLVDNSEIDVAKFLTKKMNISVLNTIQTQMFDSVYNSPNSNIVVCGPESCGKSLMVDFALFAMMKESRGTRKCVYIALNDALAKAKAQEWTRNYSDEFGWRIDTLLNNTTGNGGLAICEAANIIVATPASWDAISRKWKTKRTRRLMDSVGLFVADNLHVMDSFENSVLETIVSRMRSMLSQTRIFGLAHACVSNITDLVSWLGVGSQKFVFNFPSHVRSHSLDIHLHGFDMFNRSVRQTAMLRPLFNQIVNGQPLEGEQTVIFTTDKRQSRLVATDLIPQLGDRFKEKVADFFKTHVKGGIPSLFPSEQALMIAIEHGIGYINCSLTDREKFNLISLFQSGIISILIVSFDMLWQIDSNSIRASNVVICDTNYFSTYEKQFVDYKPADIMRMTQFSINKVFLFTQSCKREFYKKFLNEPVPIESGLDICITDWVNAEISNGTIKSRQECIDWITWSFYYRRLVGNPNYYSLQNPSHQDVSDFLSTLIEETVETLTNSGMIIDEEEEEAGGSMIPSDLGLIGSYYGVKVATIEMFRRSIFDSMKRKQLIEIISNAFEFVETISVDESEYEILEKIAKLLKISISDIFSPSSMKSLILLHAHFNRLSLTRELEYELNELILPQAHRLVLALVDVVSTCGWLKVALAAMEIGPMIVQAMTGPSANPLLQLPRFDTERVETIESQYKISDIVDFLTADDETRKKCLENLSDDDIAQIAQMCNMYPSITLSTNDHVVAAGGGTEEEERAINVVIEREGDIHLDKRGLFVPVFSRFYPREKEEGWWLVVGNDHSNSLIDIKRISITKEKENVVMRTLGANKLYLMSDSFIGCDQEEDI